MADLTAVPRLVNAGEPFVGRRRDLDSLLRLLSDGSRKGASALIEGEAGVGKSRLVAEFLMEAEKAGAQTLLAACYPVEQPEAYAPFVQILSASGDSLALLTGVEQQPALRHGDLGTDVLSYRARFVAALAQAVVDRVAHAKAGAVVCVEDVHWADVGSLIVLNQLLDMRRPGLLLLYTARLEPPATHEARELIARLRQRSSQHTVLRGLRRDDVRALFDHYAGHGMATVDEIEALRAFTGGIPLLLREVTLHLLDRGLLEKHSVPEAIRTARIPPRPAETIDWRLKGLPAATRHVLDAACVIGTDFRTDLVAGTLCAPSLAVEDELAACAERGLVVPADEHGESYRFVHPSVAARLYELVPPGRRHLLHGQVAHALESSPQPVPAAELARHYALGFQPAERERAARLCMEAAEEAERLAAHETASQYWELALRCAAPRSRPMRADIWRRLGWALWAASRWDASAKAWQEAVALYEAMGDEDGVGELALALGDTHRWRQELDQSERWLERALLIFREPSLSRARTLALLGGICCLKRDLERGRDLLQQALDIVEQTEADPFVGYWLSYGYYLSGEKKKSRAVAEQALQEAARQGNARATALLAGSVFQFELFDLHVAKARSCLSLMERAGQPADATSFNYAFVSKALLRAYQGRWRSIIRASNDWAARVRLAGRYQAATARLIWSVANLYLGNVAAARAGLLDALDGLERMQPFGQLYLALAEVQLGNEEEANALVDRYLRACGGQPRTSHDSAVFGDVVSRLSRPALWQLGYQALERERAHLVGPYSPVSTRRVLGRLATRLNRWPEAEKHFEEATRVLSDGGAKWELAQTLLDYAEMRRVRRRRGDMTKAAALQMRASELLQQLRVPQAPAPQAPPAKEANEFALTGRELEVLDLLAQGYRNQEIAKALTISPGTARRHIENILSKMGAANRTDAVVLAISKQLVGPLQEQQRRPASSPAPEVASRARSAG